MIRARSLVELLEESVRCHPHRTAIVVPNGEQITYERLGALVDQLALRLSQLGIGSGDRVGLRLHKSIGAIAAIFAILKTGAAYVPVDADSPASRGAYILADCRTKAVLTEESLKNELLVELQKLRAEPLILCLSNGGTAGALIDLLRSLQQTGQASNGHSLLHGADDDIAYLLYTSGSTGQPKGVMLSHRNALSFVDWCSATFQPSHDDRFSSHAPFHFDLSIFDIYVSIKHGASLVLIGEELGKEPMRLAQVIAAQRITIWYSTPSILSHLASYGKLGKHEYDDLRLVLFAGEVFPIPRYRALRAFWRQPRFFNLYGPTETNVCTSFEVRDEATVEQWSAFPIGRACEPNACMVIDESGNRLGMRVAGELLVSGPNVMRGYWNLPDQNSRVFFVDVAGTIWYRTGDIVMEDPELGFLFIGRRDRMVKRRGYRVELGEIEATLCRNTDIREVAVVCVPDLESGVRIVAFMTCLPEASPSAGALKTLALRSLPRYMVPDDFIVMKGMPRTSTNKVDYEALKARAAGSTTIA